MKCSVVGNGCNGRMDDILRVFVLGKIVVLESGVIQGLVIEGFSCFLVDLPKITLQGFSRLDLFSGRRRIEVIPFYTGESRKSSSSEKF